MRLNHHKNHSYAQCDLLVWSHLRWDFVFQRPQHLISRFAKERRVFFIEEPIFTKTPFPKMNLKPLSTHLTIAVPEMPHGFENDELHQELRALIDGLLESEDIQTFTCWYYTPMALPY